MLCSKLFQVNGSPRGIQLASWAFYSRKSSSKYSGSFKVVSSSQEEYGDSSSHQVTQHVNWELFAPQGFRFYMPGTIGPAWHDSISTGLMTTTLDPEEGAELECTIQACPTLLRKSVLELFPVIDANSTQTLTIVSLSQKTERLGSEKEYEQLMKQFVLAAKDICGKLKSTGYWADFINPFSGSPYLNPPHISTGILKNEDRFRCFGFSIHHFNGCQVISNKASQKFLGSLFTTAPATMAMLHDLLQSYECS